MRYRGMGVRMNRRTIDPNELRADYVDKRKSLVTISKEYGIPATTIHSALIRLGIPRRLVGDYKHKRSESTDPAFAKFFWSKTEPDGDCIVWRASCLAGGYGVVRVNGRKQVAHRVSWQITHGKIPRGLFVLHRCDNRPCVNPNHLFLGTHKDNMRDMKEKGRVAKVTGAEHYQAVLTEDDVRLIRFFYARGTDTSKELAKIFGVSWWNIRHIIRRSSWKHI